MASRFKTTLAVIALVLLSVATASADVRDQSVCPNFPSSLFTDAARSSSAVGRCWSGDHTCRVGVRGDWLDITDTVSITSGPRGTVKIVGKGVDDSAIGQCLPRSNKDREGYISLTIADISGPGTMRIRLNRLGGSDTISVEVLDGETFIGTKVASAFVDAGVAKTFELKGANMDRLRIKRATRALTGISSTVTQPTRVTTGDLRPITELDEIVSATETSARVRLTFSETGTVNLEDVLEFEGGEPELNRRIGWPTINVRRPTAAQNPPPAPQPAPGTSGPPTTSTPSVPNLTPQRLFGERPLLRKLNPGSPHLMVAQVFCSNLGNNEEREVDVPAFEWGVANDNRTAVTQGFSTVVLNGSNSTLATQTITGIPQSDLRTFRNWPGRPARVRVVKVTGPPLLSEYGNAPGCYVPTAFVGSVTLDPRPLVIRVDSGNQITESVEIDNDLVIQ